MKARVKKGGEDIPLAPPKEETQATPKRHEAHHASHQSHAGHSHNRHKIVHWGLLLIFVIALYFSVSWHFASDELMLARHESLSNITALSNSITTMQSGLNNIESLLITSALFHTTTFNPNKRMAFFRALNEPINGYEKRVSDILLKNISDPAVATIRNDFMTSFMTVRPEAEPKQETIANLFDALDDGLKQRVTLENQLTDAKATKEKIDKDLSKLYSREKFAWILVGLLAMWLLFTR